jgi:putative NADH-flavin reductase
MRIVVFGASGRTGRLVVEKALGHGNSVVGFKHSTPLADNDPRLSTVQGDIRDFEGVSSAIAGADGVVFALSQNSGPDNDVHEAGIANVIHAMAEHDVRKLAAVSAAGAFDRNSKMLSLTYRALVAMTMRAIYDDLEAMERRIMASDLDWTIVRPYGLTERPATGDYRVTVDGAVLPRAARISRADVAGVLVKAVETDAYRRRVVVIAD